MQVIVETKNKNMPSAQGLEGQSFRCYFVHNKKNLTAVLEQEYQSLALCDSLAFSFLQHTIHLMMDLTIN